MATSIALPAYAENTADEAGFPDEIFRNYVSESFDSDKDGSLSEQEILYTSEVDMISSSVSSLKGIELFMELRKYNYIKSTPEVTAENVLNREFYADAPNEKWITVEEPEKKQRPASHSSADLQKYYKSELKLKKAQPIGQAFKRVEALDWLG